MAINYPKIVADLENNHKLFLEKYREFIEKNINERHLKRESIYAKIKLIGDAFVKARVVKSSDSLDINGFSRSLVLKTSVSSDPVYILNDGDNVEVTIGSFVGNDIHQKATFLARDGSSLVFHRVLDDDFDWENFSKSILELIHQNAYRKSEVLDDYVDYSVLVGHQTSE